MAETGEGDMRGFFRVSFQHSPFGEAVIGLDGRLIAVNPALCDLLGYGAADLQGAPAARMLGLEGWGDPARGEDEGATLLDRMVSGELRSFSRSLRYQRRDGTWVWLACDLSVAEDDHHEEICVLVRVRDVSEPKERDARTDLAVREITVDNVRTDRAREEAEFDEERYTALFDGIPDTVALVFGADKRIVAARGAVLAGLGLDPGEMVGCRAAEVFDRRDAAPLERYVEAALTAGRRTAVEVHARTFGSDVSLDVVPVEHRSGRREALVVARDIGARREHERRLQAAECRWRASFEQAIVPMAEVTGGGVVVSANPAFAQLVGAGREELVGADLLSLVHPEDRESASRQLAWAAGGPQLGRDTELQVVRRDGSVVVVASRSAALVSDGADGDNLVVHWVDIGAEKAAEQAAADAQAHFAALVEHSSDVIIVLDPDLRITYASPAFAKVFDMDMAEFMGRPLALLAHDGDDEAVRLKLRTAAGEPQAVTTFEIRVLHRDGGWHNVEVTVSNLLDNPAVGGLVCNCRDVTDRVQLADWLAHEAAHDPLTGLANRALLRDRMDQALARIRRSGSRCAVLFIDLDHFKQVNDSRGHSAGDQLLVAVADRIRTVMRPNDTVARYGGDEFVVLAEDVPDEASALILAGRVLDAVVAPVVLFDDRISVSASIGVAVSRGHSVEALLDEADAALYEAKRLGRNRIALADGLP